MNTIARELDKARQNLIDLTLRNRLLNYRTSAVRTIRVIDEVPAEIYEALVLREKTLEFRGVGSAPTRDAASDPSQISTTSHSSPTWQQWQPQSGETLKPTHIDRYLQTPYDHESLSKKLFRVYHEGRTVVEEQGYTVIHLAIAFLEWFEPQSNEPRRAPLLLIPSELERIRAGDFSRVRWTGQDVVANVSLIAKMSEYGITLPGFTPPEEKHDVDSWLGLVADTVREMTGWRVLSDMVLDFFSFTKFVMYSDLDPTAWPEEKKPQDHPLLKTLFEPGTDAALDQGFDEREIDVRFSARDLMHVMDADPSQIVVTQDVKAGRNLVVQGPPGTGKSQTITNIISETLAAGKTVLFVSEKMAALQVVKSRLDAVGLGPFCLELHSRKSNKKNVLEELQHSLISSPLRTAPDELIPEHDRLRDELNQLASELGSPIGSLTLTPYELYGMRQNASAHFEKAGRSFPAIADLPRPKEMSDIRAAEAALRELMLRIPGAQPVASNVWRSSLRDSILPHDEQEISTMLVDCRQAIAAVKQSANALMLASGVVRTDSFADCERAAGAAQVLSEIPGAVEPSLLLNEQWNAASRDVDNLLLRVSAIQQKRVELGSMFRTEALDWDCAERLLEFRPLAKRFFRLFNSRYRVVRSQLAALYVANAPRTKQLLADLERLASLQREQSSLRRDARGPALYGRRWSAESSDLNELRRVGTWLLRVRREIVAGVLSARSVDLAAPGTNSIAIAESVKRVRESVTAAESELNRLLTWARVDANAAFGGPIPNVTLTHVDEVLEVWQQRIAGLFGWIQFNSARVALRNTISAPLEKFVIDGSLQADDLAPAFQGALAESLLRSVFAERSSLARFAGDVHEQKIARFRDIDRTLVEVNRGRVSQLLHDRRPQISGGASRNSEVGILVGEFSRRRGHMPIRKLLSSAGRVIQLIKPCFLMSPLSVAQFLDPRLARFDLIIFDEASQVRPEDALGALLRGTQLVVMGDTRQLPPTTFFDHLVDSDDAADIEDLSPEAASVTDVESVLHQCVRSYPTKTLSWHYRSRHESLIAVSNFYFYDNLLRIYPSAIDTADEIGLHFRHLPESVYDRGKSSTNIVEAKAVAEAVIDHYRRFPERSLGVGTFNIKQQDAILREVDAQLARYPELEPLFKSDRREAFFVKNLETIQGDERDVIFISVAFGRDANGRLSMNFGPVNRDGGERRLNVLISRAKEKSVVFSNFTFRDMQLDDGSARGVIALRAFLQYAETRQLPARAQEEARSGPPLNDAIGGVLESQGYRVRKQVGCAGFRVDLAVVDPDSPGRYLLGIECDGPKYHNSRVARDRDRLRDEMLGKLKWRVHRVWSTDWYRDRDETVKRIFRALEEARRIPRQEVLEPPVPTPESDSAVQESLPAQPMAVATLSKTLPELREYETCRSVQIPLTGELHLVPPRDLAVAVENVVQIESPVHLDEVVRRLRTLWGLARAGSRIRDAVEHAARYAVRKGRIEFSRDEFLRLPNVPVVPRRRDDDPPPRIDLISDDEIAEVIRIVLNAQFSTAREDLITAVARRFGIQSTSEATAKRIGRVIDQGARRTPPSWSVELTGLIRPCQQA